MSVPVKPGQVWMFSGDRGGPIYLVLPLKREFAPALVLSGPYHTAVVNFHYLGKPIPKGWVLLNGEDVV